MKNNEDVSISAYGLKAACKAVAKKSLAFLANESGNFVVTFAISGVAILLSAGLAMNYSAAFRYQVELQNATDSATLAAAAVTGTNITQDVRSQAGTDFFKANFDSIPAEIAFDYPDGAVRGTASYNVPAILGKVFGNESIEVGATAVVGLPGDGSVELVFVLDYSGSMYQNGKYISMRNAAIAMIEEFKQSPGKDNIKLSLVPFSEYVFADIDASTIRVVHPSKYGETARACLGSRFAPFATSGDTPNANDENSKWPTIGLSKYFSTAGAEKQEQICTVNKKGESTCEICTTTTNSKGTAKTKCQQVKAEKQASNSLKATQEKAMSAFSISDPECQSYLNNGLMSVPLNTDHDKIIAQLKVAKPVQLTNIALAMDVAWHMISPQAPFTQGEGKTGSKPKRYVVLFTDGAQTVPGYGLGNGNSGTGTGGSDPYTVNQAEENTAVLCDSIKKDAIEIITIAFQLGTGRARNQMQACASRPTYFFETESQGELASIFQEIAGLVSSKLFLRE